MKNRLLQGIEVISDPKLTMSFLLGGGAVVWWFADSSTVLAFFITCMFVFLFLALIGGALARKDKSIGQ